MAVLAEREEPDPSPVMAKQHSASYCDLPLRDQSKIPLHGVDGAPVEDLNANHGRNMNLRGGKYDTRRPGRSLLHRCLPTVFAATMITIAATMTTVAGAATTTRAVASSARSPVRSSATKVAATTSSLPSVEYGHDQEGTSWYPDQTGLTPQLVSGGSFGQLFKSTIDGQAFAQPLVADGVLLVETSQNWIYGMNPKSGAISWSRKLGNPVSASSIGCADIGGGQGIIGTPVVDQNTDTEYFTANTYVSGTSGPSLWSMHAVNVLTGAEQSGFPVPITGAAQNDPTATFNAAYQLQRPGLLLTNGVVYAAFGSHCDLPPTEGWVVGVTETGTLQAMWTDEVGGPQPRVGGIWQAGGALISDGPGQILFATGNGGDYSTPAPGDQPPDRLGESVIRLQVQPSGTLTPSDFFEPYDSKYLNQIDGDVGSGAPVLLPPAEFGTATYPHLAIEIGKAGYLYVLNADNLGGFEQGPSGSDDVLSRIGPIGGLWGKPTVWAGDGGYIYFTTASSTDVTASGQLVALKYGVTGSGMPTFSEVGAAADPFTYGSGQPIVTSSGTTSGSSILWTAWTGNSQQPGELRAYNPIPVAGTLQLLWEGPIGTVNKWTAPGIYDSTDGSTPTNMVYIPNQSGQLYGFGSPVTEPLSGSPVAFGNVTVGGTATIAASFTATEATTVTSVSTTTGEFTVGAVTPALPTTLQAGQTLTVPVRFSPTAYGGAGGTLTFNTTVGNYQIGENGFGLASTGLLAANPQSISFGGVATGQATTQTATFTNEGAEPLTINSITPPSAPFSVSGLPVLGTILDTNQSVTVLVTFAPTVSELSTDNLTIGSDDGGAVDVPMSGNSAAPGILQVTPDPISFGQVPVGDTVTFTFHVANVGQTAIEITKSKPPVANTFTALTSLLEGTVITPGEVLKETVAFTPTSLQTFKDVWILNATGNSSLINEPFDGTGIAPTPVGPPSAGGWLLLGNAISGPGGAVDLTQPTPSQLGAAVAPEEVATDGLSVAFTTSLGGGTGGDGVTLTFASGNSHTFMGGSGGGVGYVGITGTAVVLRTFRGTGEPSGNFVGIADGPNATNPVYANYLHTNTAIPPLRNTTHNVVVTTAGTQLTVTLDGAQVLQYSDPNLPPRAYLDFTGSTGGQDDLQAISNVVISHTTQLTATPSTVNVGNVLQGTTGSATVNITNSSLSTIVLSTATVSSGPFTISGLPGPDTVIPPGTSIPATVTFSPTTSAFGYQSTAVILATDGGTLSIPVTATAAGLSPAVGWNLFGSATQSPGQITLTPATSLQAGSALDPQLLTTKGLQVSFTETITGGTGADGMTMTLASPTSPSFLGHDGGGLGYVGGPTGTSVVFRTFKGPIDPSNNFVAIADGDNMSWPNYLATNTTVPKLRNATHHMVVSIVGTVVTVSMDDSQVLRYSDPQLPAIAELDFTAGTGGSTDEHIVSNVIVSSGATNPTKGGWQLNGTSVLSGSTLQLTPATNHVAGSAFWPVPVDPTNLNAAFTATIGPGTGGSGLAFVIVPSIDGATALGTGSSAYGWGQLGGVAVALDTFKNINDPSANFVGVTSSENANGPVWMATATGIPNLQGTNLISVSTSNGTLTVSVDGTQVISVAVILPASALVGFTGATGGLDDVQGVSSPTITY
jgi:Abnormal spindle-like microcephaly-assoc'd, ASPM-SPD-2-Hydin/Flagellar-associated PapD-like